MREPQWEGHVRRSEVESWVRVAGFRWKWHAKLDVGRWAVMQDDPIPNVLRIDGHQPTIPLPPAAQEALNNWMVEKHDEMFAVLEPFGIHPVEMQLTEWRRVVVLKDSAQIDWYGGVGKQLDVE